RTTAHAQPRARRSPRRGRRAPCHNTRGRRGRMDAAQPRGRRRNRRLPPPRSDQSDPDRGEPRADHPGHRRDRRSSTMRTAIGFIGLGAMGSRIAGRLLDSGHQLYGTNRTAAKAQPLIDRGMIWLDTPREVAAAADIVISMVTNDNALEAIALGPDGILAGITPGTVYVDMSTV